MKDALDLQKFYPEEISVTEVIQNEKEIYIHVSVQSKNCTCPKCGVISEHKHGTYKRKLQDLPILGRTTYLIVNAYEYQCDNSSCDVTTFVENVDGFLNYYSRMTERCEDFICTLALETSCEGSARICRSMNLKTSGDSIIRLLTKRYVTQPEVPCGSIIGVDDFAFKKWHTYGTIIVDETTHKPVAILDGRDGKTLKEWLSKNKHVKTITRNRASAYSAAIKEILPDAMQIADRFHLHQNLLEAIRNTINSVLPNDIRIPTDSNIIAERSVENSISSTDISSDEINQLKDQMQDMQLEIDILKETINVLKKDPDIDQSALSNREKAVIIDVLKNRYSLPLLLQKLQLSKSSYYYQEQSLQKEDKYTLLRVRVIELFTENKGRYGYRRIHALLKRENIIVSEKVIRRIMKEEQLVVKIKRTRKYNSYQGEISPAVDNLINRNFSASKPNEKWLTDITEFAIPAGKVYLSPIVDCFDGLLVNWNISTSPDALLVNSMLDDAAKLLSVGEKPIIHSDRGVHYRWPGWIDRMEKNGFIRSMSKKGCSPDNSACEGVFGRIKNEMFYNADWSGVNISEFIGILNDYLYWYNEKRIKKSLGYLSPIEYRHRLGLVT